MSRTCNEQKKVTVRELLENDDTDLEGVSDGSSNDITSLRESLFEMDSEEETELKATKKITEESVRYFLILFYI
uniref:CTNNB1_binding domain-containing protein n=1 Tax=Ascaris lumbricoides TaxID=6252 RepID=A0A0M3HJT3_ASCLU